MFGKMGTEMHDMQRSNLQECLYKVHALGKQSQTTDLPEQSCLLGGSQSSQSILLLLLLLLKQLSSLRAVLGEAIALEPL